MGQLLKKIKIFPGHLYGVKNIERYCAGYLYSSFAVVAKPYTNIARYFCMSDLGLESNIYLC